MTHVNQIVGAYGECLAARYAVRGGMTLVARNWRGTAGELDLILRDGPDLAFCEVKTRRSLRYGLPVEAIVPAKALRIRRLAVEWLALTRPHHRDIRFDVLSVLATRDQVAIEHRRDAF
jgi:putative endonuclease